nr:hypothetical protein [Kibdelosporangium sp. MJ126-NF4]CEL17449.1 hypothetical protein [Kibdelosporangium sp. MJ126-NF4]CTQ91324.1 hypothetical protein [Kibdelosporangium sp. MJ126-NF4]
MDTADQGQPLGLADRRGRGAQDRWEPEPSGELLSDGPVQERAQQVLVRAVGGGVPAVNVGLGALGETAVLCGEAGKERGGLTQLTTGVGVAVRANRDLSRRVAQVSQDVPGGVLPEQLKVLRQPGRHGQSTRHARATSQLVTPRET